MDARVRALNTEPVRAGAAYVLYWAQTNRRVRYNHALEYAARLANQLGLPLLYYEGLTYAYPLANARIHTFYLQGVPETARRLRERGIGHFFWLRRTPEDSGDVFLHAAAGAAAVVTDDYPDLPLGCSNLKTAALAGAACLAVDSSCVVPMGALARRCAAGSFRTKLRKLLPDFLKPVVPVALRHECCGRSHELHVDVTDANIPSLVASCSIDQSVRPSVSFRGGTLFAEAKLENFLTFGLRRYARERDDPAARATSELSPYLHCGHISSLEVALRARRYAARHKLAGDEFLERLIVRRERAFNFARYSTRVDSLDALPGWAYATLRKHAADRRPFRYSQEEFVHAATHDELWNAAQKEMLLRGVIHPYYRMYWGKKVIEWSRTCDEALATMLHIHRRFALDGRDPNTFANILWCFGLDDRPRPERPVFGAVRSISRQAMERETDVGAYIRQIEELWTSQ